MYIFNSC